MFRTVKEKKKRGVLGWAPMFFYFTDVLFTFTFASCVGYKQVWLNRTDDMLGLYPYFFLLARAATRLGGACWVPLLANGETLKQ